MYTVTETTRFSKWVSGLRDNRARLRIANELLKMESGLFGNCKSIGAGLYEVRVSEGKGYRAYYFYKSENTIVMLCGGNKSSQQRDIHLAREIINEYQKL